MRIHPIGDCVDVHTFPVCDSAGIPACPLQKRERKLQTSECCRKSPKCKPANPDVNRVLLRRAFNGLLSRMRTFDWQVIHGHQVGGCEKRGAFLDVNA